MHCSCFLKFFYFKIFAHKARRSSHNSSEVMKMTSKELLYVEDALGHEQYFKTKCQETAGQIQDADLKTCVEQLAQKHQQLFQNFYNLL